MRCHPDPAVVSVGDEQVARGVCRRDLRRAEFGADSRAAVSGEPAGAVPGHGVDVPAGHRLAVEGAGRGGDHPDPAVVKVGDQQVPGGIDGHPLRAEEPGADSRAAVSGEPGGAAPGHGVDVPGGHRPPVKRAGAGRRHPDPVVDKVRDQQVAGAVCRHPEREVEFGADSRAAVAGEPRGAVAGHGVDVPGGHRLPVERAGGGRHRPDPVVVKVGDQHVAGGVDGHPVRAVEFGADSRAAVAGEPRGAVAGHGVDVPGGHRLPVEDSRRGCHHPDPAVAVVGEHQVARGVHRDTLRRGEFGADSRAAVAGEPPCAVAGHGVHVPGGHRLAVEDAAAGRRHPDPVMVVVDDHQVARVVHRDPARGQARPGRAAAIAERAGSAGARRGGQPVGAGVHPPHRPGAGDVEIPSAERHAARIGKSHLGCLGRAADPPGHRRDHPSRAGRGRRRARRRSAGSRRREQGDRCGGHDNGALGASHDLLLPPPGTPADDPGHQLRGE